MKIGFDAKRAFNNNTGLGHYSRTLISNLATLYTDYQYFLFAPKVTKQFNTSIFTNIKTITPNSLLSKFFKNLWRGCWVKKDIKKLNIDIYHGLSHQIPIGINTTNTKSIVTIHDLIFERYPEQHGKINVWIYRNKFKHACKYSNAIIAISQQTKIDLINYYNIPEHKIFVCYQTCNSIFMTKKNELEKQQVKKTYNLPDKYFITVGSITERKNLLTLCKALKLLDNNIPLVVIGNGKKYKAQVVQYLKENNLQHLVIFLNETEAAQSENFKNSIDFPAIYQAATAFLYASTFEGFGIPILEALWSGIPVISSNNSCMPETGGDAALYVDAYDAQAYANSINNILTDINLAAQMVQKGFEHAQKFTDEKCTQSVMEVYKSVLK